MTAEEVDHPLAMNVLVWGILGVCCCAVGGPIAWIRGRRVLRDIAASGGTMGGRSEALVGYVLGIISTLYTVLFIVVGVAYIVITRKP
ncbi:MAG TPA: DUF4190 domain-containing protein [Mycobacterium sp.]|jgi:hypothetical protein|nr:DUF4190 domain-containing protein [Mycobacterium sp.]